MTARDIEDIFGLSPLQEGMLFHTLRSPGSGVYIEQLCCLLRGNLDVTALQEAWRKVAERHQALRISVVREGLDRPLQVVHRTVEPEWRREDWRALEEAERARRLEKALSEDRARGFDPTRAPLMRFALVRTGDAEWQFIWTFHHMLLDGWSASLVMDEIEALYGSRIRGREPRLARPIPYREFIAWLARQETSHAREFWSRTLASLTSCARLPSDFPAGELSGAEASEEPALDERSTILPDALASGLQAFGKRHRLTLSTLFQGALAVLLARLCGVREVLFGNTVSGRPSDLPGIESMVGLFINTLPVRASFAPESPVVEWLHALQRHQAEARRYDFVPLVDVQAWSRIPRGEPLFEVLLVLENYPERGSTEDEMEVGLQVIRTRSIERTNYPLTVIVDPGPPLSVRMAFDRRRFEAVTIERMLGRIETLLEGLAAGPPARLADLPLMREDERSRVLVEWNATTTSYPRDSAITALFDERVRRAPEAVAVVCGERRITYSDLSRRADRIVARLRSLGVRAETAVGICAERSIEMIAGLLGILRAGGAWVPLDPSYPRERLALMMEDAGVRIVLAQPRTADCLPETRARVVPLEASDAREDLEPRNAHAFATHDAAATGASGDRLACIFYTSGSTGRPKGVAVTHRAIVRLVTSPNYVVLGSDQTILQLAPISFDASLFEIWGALLNGGRLVLMPPGAPSLEELGREIVRRRVTTLWLTAPLFHQMVDGPIESLRGVTQLLAGGDVLSPSCVKKAIETLAETKLINGYGPTEGTTFTCCHAVAHEPRESRSIPIGRPISNTRVYILDESFHPLPIGIAGELFIGGDGLARGYQHDPALTAEKFVPDPIAAAGPGGRLYRSGDRARWLPDGTIEFLGRADRQTKIRGHRVEAGEVEALLGQHPSVSQAVVAPREHGSGERRLVAWVVPRPAPGASGSLDPQDGIDPAALRAFLQERLPLYMVPSAFVTLRELPLTASGKPDRLRLPTPAESSGAGEGAGRGRAGVDGEGDAPASPRSPIEEILAGIWARLLRVDAVGVHESFFDLGGHSLVATQVVSRIRERIGVELPLAAIFEAPTVAALAAKVAAALEDREEEGRAAAGVPPRSAPPIDRLGARGSPPPSFAQERLWFLDQLEPGSSFYSIADALRLEGRLDRVALERSLAEIVRRHEVLRTTFSVSGGLPVPVVHPAQEHVLETTDLSEVGTERPANERSLRETAVSRIVSEEARAPFDLQSGPLFRARLLRLDEEEHVLIVTMHHIVSDAWSIGVLVDEMAALYDAYSSGRPSPLPELAIQYGDYAAWQREWLRGEVLEGHVAFWKRRLEGAPAVLDLPTDRPRPAVLTFRGSQIDVSLGPELSRSLRSLARREDVTLFMLALAAFQTLLHRHTGQADIVVGVPVAGRSHAEIEPLIGFFVNTLPVRTSFSGDPTFRRLLARVRRTALETWAHQDLPFERLVEALSPPRDPGRTPVFQTMLVMDNAPVDDLRLPGLRVTPLSSPSDTAKFELVLSLGDSQDGELTGSLEYNSDLFDEATIAAMGARLRTLLEGIVTDADRRISELPVLTNTDARCVQVGWNDTRVDDPDAGLCLHELIERRAGSSSGAIAVGLEDKSLTYGALERRANALAHRLRSMGVGPDVVVGICMERSLELIVALLGTLKAGGAYLPLDPEHPEARLARQIEATGPSVLLSQGHLSARLPESRPPTIFLAPDDDAVGTADAIAPPRTKVRSLNLAYVIPTSGSTGAPKGVMIPHRGIVNRLLWMQRQYGLTMSDRVLQKTPITFDVSVWEIFWPLLAGARLVLARPGGHRDAAYLARTIAERGITTIHFVPSMLEQFLREPDLPRPGPLVRVISSGEALRTDLQERFFERVGAPIHNLYGPTEVSVDATFWPCERDDGRGVPIGRPIANTRAYVLDRALRPVPPGGVGELHLAGIGLARGYRGRPDLTAACFVPDPFCPGEPGGRLYRTGDLSRQRSDGTLEYLGRVDQQAKIRGIRIEPAEIEAALGEHPAVRESAVVVREEEGAGKRLVGYVVAEGSPEPAELRAFLRARLPEEMVPFAIRQLERMPLTPSGKLDRKALPAIGGGGGDRPNAFIAPRNGVEEALARIWSEVLGVARVGATDDLFDLGGHSLLATQILHRIRDVFDVELPLRGLFEEATVEALARSVVTREPVPGRSEKVAAIVNRIEAMPPEALRRTLAQRDGSKELT